MGHLISILNKLVDLCSSISLGEYFKTNLPEVAKSLDEFKETTLSETNKLQDSLLVSTKFNWLIDYIFIHSCGSNVNKSVIYLVRKEFHLFFITKKFVIFKLIIHYTSFGEDNLI